MRLFQAALDTPLDSPFSATLSVHGLHFTVYLPSIKFGLLACPMTVRAEKKKKNDFLRFLFISSSHFTLPQKGGRKM